MNVALCRTLQNEVTLRGVALHSGRSTQLTLQPREQSGWVFARTDLPDAPEIRVAPQSIAHTAHATTLAHADIKISTIEHLLAALWTRGITHCRIAVDGDEVPILDGSAKPWCELLESAGTRELKTKRARYGLREAVAVHDGQGCVLGLPHSSLRVSTSVAYATWWDSHQCVDCEVSPASFARELAPARTFTLEAWIEPLRERGLIRGGSPDNALILGDSGPSAPWRLPQELARHKALDVLGDIAILFGADGGDLCAHLIATKAGHELHRLWMHECLRRDALVRLL